MKGSATRLLLTWAVLAVAYSAAGKVGLLFATTQQNVTLVWPPTGIALAAVLLGGPRVWPGVALGAFAVTVTTGLPLWVAALIAAGNTLEALTGAFLLKRDAEFDGSLGRARDVLALVALVAGCAATVSATVGVTGLWLSGHAPAAVGYGRLWLYWWAGDALGALLVTPAILTWAAAPRRPRDAARVAEAFALGAGLTLVSLAVFGWAERTPTQPQLAFAVFPFLIWAALRFGQRGTATFTLLAAAVAVAGTAAGANLGPTSGTFEQRHLHLHAYLGVVAVTAMLLAAVLAERERAQRELQQAIGLLRAVADGTTDAVFVKDREGRYLLFNEAAARFVSRPAEEVLGRTDADLFDPHGAELVTRRDRRVMVSGLAETEEEELTAAGVTRTYLATKAPYRDDRGEILGVIGISHDITERKRAERALRESEARFRAIVEATPECVKLVNRDGMLLKMNDAGLTMIEAADEGAVLGQCVYNLIAPEDREAFQAFNERVCRGVRGALEFDIIGLKGTRRRMESTAVPLPAPEGGFTHLAVTRDVTERKRAEEALTLFRALIDRTNDGVEVIDPATGRFLDVNERACLAHGYTREEYLALSVPDLDPVVAARPWEEVAEGVRRAGFLTVQGLHRRKDGTIFPVEVNVNYVRLNRDYMLAVVRDVTDRKRAEEALRREREFIRLVLDTDPNLIFVKDADGRFVLANRALADLYRLCPEDLVGRAPGDGLPAPAELPQYRRAEAEVLRRGEAIAADEANTRPDGRTFWFHTIRVPLVLPDGTTHVLGICADITERKRAEEAMRHAQRRLQYVVASSPAVLFALAVEGGQVRGISWVSDNLREVLGHAPEDALSPGWWLDNIHPEDRDPVVTRTHDDLFALGRTTYECRFRHRDGTYRWTRGDIRLVSDLEGEPAKAVGSWLDVTEQKQVADQLRQAQKMDALGQLAGGVAHDFNNLLCVINGYAALLLRGMGPADPRRKAVAAIGEAGERAAGLTGQLLAFGRRAVLEPKVIDINSAVSEVEELLRRLIGEDVALAFSPGASLSRVWVDLGQFGQVLMNLVLNARDAMPSGGRLTIETANVELDEAASRLLSGTRPGPYVMTSVSDTGCGMTDEVKARAFEPFFTTKPAGKGTGLGLATVYGIVKDSGGCVEVQTQVGRGSVFKVYLPAVEALDLPADGGATEVRGGVETLLLAEDEPGVRELARAALESHGYTVLDAADGTAALRLVEERGADLDLLVTDVVMPHLGGRELAEALRGRYPGLKVLYVSGYTDDAVVRQGVLAAEAAFLQKPYTPDSLARKVREALDRA